MLRVQLYVVVAEVDGQKVEAEAAKAANASAPTMRMVIQTLVKSSHQSLLSRNQVAQF
jgi:hypothetical protein